MARENSRAGETYMRRARIVKQKINTLKQELRSLKEQMEDPGLGSFLDGSDAVCGSSPTESPFARRIEVLDERERAVQSELTKLSLEYLATLHTLDRMEPQEQDLLRCRYLEDMQWKTIASSVGMSRRSVFRLRDKALQSLTLLLEGDD